MKQFFVFICLVSSFAVTGCATHKHPFNSTLAPAASNVIAQAFNRVVDDYKHCTATQRFGGVSGHSVTYLLPTSVENLLSYGSNAAPIVCILCTKNDLFLGRQCLELIKAAR